MDKVYIGARYVPRFANPIEWNQAFSYEPLTIVTYQNNSYTSKQPVPAGVAITNSEYWALTGNYNGQLENLNGLIMSVSEDLQDYQSLMTTKAKNRKFIFIGDSYGHASGQGFGWIDQITTMMELNTGQFWEYAQGGYSFGNANANFLELLQRASAITNKNQITDIVVLGGANERGFTVDTITNGVNAFVNYANSTFPNAIVRIGFVGGTSDANVKGVQYSRGLMGYSNSKAAFLNNLQYVLHDYSFISNDTVHPNRNGYDAISKHLFGALNGGTNVFYYDTSLSGTVIDAIDGTSIGAVSANVTVNNGITTLSSSTRIDVTYSTPVSLTVGSATQVLHVASNYIMGATGAANQSSISTFCLVRSSINNTQYVVHGNLNVSGKFITFTPYDTILGTTTAFNSCDVIAVLPFTFSADSMAL